MNKIILTLIILICCICVLTDVVLAYNMTNFSDHGWTNPINGTMTTNEAYDYLSDTYYKPDKQHIGIDIVADLDSHVYAITEGEVVYIKRETSATENASVIYIRHKTMSGIPFITVYGHCRAEDNISLNDWVFAGEPVGKIKRYNYPDHLHFGINENENISGTGWGLLDIDKDAAEEGWRNPVDFLAQHTPAPYNIYPVDSISTGNVRITGVDYGNSPGTINISICNPTETIALFTEVELASTISPTVSNENWTDTEIRLNIFNAPLTYDKFVMPIKIVIKDSTSKIVASLYYPFKDVPQNPWYAEYITRAWRRGVIGGYNNSGYFKPENDTNRAEFITIAEMSYGQCSTSNFEPTYTDVSEDDWFYPYVKGAWNLGWLDKAKTTFRPGDPINRAEAAKIVSIAANFQDEIESSIFNDVQLTDWFAPYVMRLALYDRDIVVGYNEDGQRLFKPGTNIKRAGVVKIVEKAFHSEDY